VNSPAAKKPEPPKNPILSVPLARLEEVVRRLKAATSLDDAMKVFEEGVALSRECQKQLEEAEGRVEILLKKADGSWPLSPSIRAGDGIVTRHGSPPRPIPCRDDFPHLRGRPRNVDAALERLLRLRRATCLHSYGHALQRLRRR